jgi:hypothetical protein
VNEIAYLKKKLLILHFDFVASHFVETVYQIKQLCGVVFFQGLLSIGYHLQIGIT